MTGLAGVVAATARRALAVAAIAMLGAGALLAPQQARAQGGPLEITVSGADLEPVPIAISPFLPLDPTLSEAARNIASVIAADLEGSGLFRLIDPQAFIAPVRDFNTVPQYNDWRTINAQALVTGTVAAAEDGRLILQFRVFDTLAEEQLAGQQIFADPQDWRRVAHKVADGVYTNLTGEGPYFDSRIAFVDETGPKGDRQKRIAIMDQDGANVRYATTARGLVLAPRFSPNDQSLLYISYETGQPEVALLSLDTGQREQLGRFPGMTFAPRFSPDGREVVLSLSQGGNTDLFAIELASRTMRRLTRSPAIDTSPDYSPDGSQMVFESDRSGSPQLYVMPARGGAATRISFGNGSYGTPVWSPRGDRVAFTKIVGGRFHIGVMRTDGSEERLLSSSFLDEGPTFSPNGRVLMFFRESPGATGRPQLYSIDITGRNLRPVPTPNGASDPSWSPLRN